MNMKCTKLTLLSAYREIQLSNSTIPARVKGLCTISTTCLPDLIRMGLSISYIHPCRQSVIW